MKLLGPPEPAALPNRTIIFCISMSAPTVPPDDDEDIIEAEEPSNLRSSSTPETPAMKMNA